ncbi:hypothetical protein BUTYVIB_01679 [Eshraghiella crossota DSM 2876]|uniref:Uncharacterized protein n=1 Tax=Eshraghiella crossota DSM 2876 TaxID=511680 RepID=D4S0R0_9FIRM|nr:hypothetical protein BUTYVIB_01679 [Butyrivibrio crossotus DSM 2876]
MFSLKFIYFIVSDCVININEYMMLIFLIKTLEILNKIMYYCIV